MKSIVVFQLHQQGPLSVPDAAIYLSSADQGRSPHLTILLQPLANASHVTVQCKKPSGQFTGVDMLKSINSLMSNARDICHGIQTMTNIMILHLLNAELRRHREDIFHAFRFFFFEKVKIARYVKLQICHAQKSDIYIS